jgi:hypothetical protein
MPSYRFSPIKNEQELREAASFIADELHKLSRLLLDAQVPIKSIKIFTHYSEEYDTLKGILNSLGEPSLETATSYYVKLHEPLNHGGQHIDLLGIRIADPYRSQVGCGDLDAKQPYNDFVQQFVKNDDPTSYIRKTVGHSLDMVELWHPDNETLGYILAAASDWTKPE